MAELFRRNPTALFADVGRDIVALNVERGHGYGLEGVTAKVWSLLETPHSLNGLCRALMDAYDVDEERCRREVGELLAEMCAEQLVEKVA